MTTRLEETQECLNFLVRRASRIIARHYDVALKPIGIRSTQFNIMAVLAQTGAMPISGLASLLIVERSALARNLKPLERQGYVAVTIGKDKRSRVAAMTKRGVKKLRSALPSWSKAQKRLSEQLGAAEAHNLVAALRKLVHGDNDR